MKTEEPLGTRLNKVVSHSSSWLASQFKWKEHKLRENKYRSEKEASKGNCIQNFV